MCASHLPSFKRKVIRAHQLINTLDINEINICTQITGAEEEEIIYSDSPCVYARIQ